MRTHTAPPGRSATHTPFEGTLSTWNDDRGFGFIEPSQGGQNIFVHIKAFPPGTGRPRVGQALTFQVEVGPDGKKRALNVQFPARARPALKPRKEAPAPWTWPRLMALPAFGALAAFVVVRWGVQPMVGLLYLGASAVSFMAYVFDKSAAVRQSRRTPEQTLHLLDVVGGWPGGLLAQQLLRHKTAKPAFVATFWGTVVVNVAAFLVWHTGLLGALLGGKMA